MLKLVKGSEEKLKIGAAFWITFGTWFLALLITILALFPRKWKVNPQVMQQDPALHSKELGIEDFYKKSAGYKRRMLLCSSLLFFAGIFCAAFAVF